MLTIVRKDADGLLDVHADARGDQRQERPREDARAGLRLHARSATSRNAPARTSRSALKDFYKQGELKGLVLDVRTDPGGLLNQAVAVSAAFLPKDALVVYTDGRTPDARMRLTASARELQRRGDDWFRDLPAGVKKVPMVVLVDGGTASASEIVAGALQDHKRATVMGAPTFGKGSVQTILPLGNNAGLKLTTARYYTPVGPLDPGEGHRARHRHRRRPRYGQPDPRSEPRAATSTPGKQPATRRRRVDARGRTAPATTMPKRAGADSHRAPPPRFDFGSPDDFQLKQAMNHLKGEPVVASIKARRVQHAPTTVMPAK